MDVECVFANGTVAENEACVDIRLIELNSFGAELAAASGLFHWVRDATLLDSVRVGRRRRGEGTGVGAGAAAEGGE